MSNVLRVVCRSCGSVRNYYGGDVVARARMDICGCGYPMLRDDPRTTPHPSECCPLTPEQRHTSYVLLASVFGD